MATGMENRQRKLCLMGDPGVGKTAVAACLDPRARQRAVGVSLYRWSHAGHEFILWDSAGQSALDTLGQAFLADADGFVLVADPARPDSVDMARQLLRHAFGLIGRRPSLLLLNGFSAGAAAAATADWPAELCVAQVQANSCNGVVEAFAGLAQRMLAA